MAQFNEVEHFDNEGGSMQPIPAYNEGPAWLEEDDYEDVESGSGLIGVMIGAVCGSLVTLLLTYIF